MPLDLASSAHFVASVLMEPVTIIIKASTYWYLDSKMEKMMSKVS